MKKKEEIKYFNKEWNQMNNHPEAFLENGDQEELHKFRVQIKKLRAMLNLIEHTSHKQRLLKKFKPVRKIFKYAGHIRDAHTNLLLGDRYKLKNEVFETGQQKIITDGIVEFQLHGKKYLKNLKNSYKLLKKQLPKVGDDAITDFYKNQLEDISIKLQASNFDDEMHDNRKLIKILVYNQRLAGSALDGSLHLNAEYLDKLQKAIGDWHDNIVAAKLFSTPELNDLPVVKKINKKNAGVRLNITKLADNFFKKATETEVVKIANPAV
jgi:CHAD domain-containing protein